MLLLAASIVAPPAEAKTNKVRHTAVVAPAWSGTVPSAVGQLTDLEVRGDVVYVAGSAGIAALSAAGEAKWTLTLPPAAFRGLHVDDGGLAFTAYTLKDVDPAKGFRAFVMGSVGDVPTYDGATIGAVTLDGALVWQVASEIQSPLSPPGLSPGSVAVMRGKDMIVVDRGDGHTLAVADLKYVGEDSKFFAGFFARGHRGQPVWWGDRFYASFYGTIVKTDGQGGGRETAFGPLFRPFYNVTCELVPFGDTLLGGSTGDSQKGNTWFAIDPKFDAKMNEWSPDKQSGCGSIAVVGERAYLASNFYVWSINAKGRVQWQSVNKKGGLYPSSARGVRYVSGLGFRKSPTDLLVADDKHVYVATDNGGDVVTVLGAGDGAYVRTIDVKAPIVALGLAGDTLVVATDGDVRFLPAGG
ncbi:MAG: hypothetical protein ACOZNI_24205 [Myxococcota bacterium]